MFDPRHIRQDFPALSETVHGRPLIYLDNAATAQTPLPVMEAVTRCELSRGNVHRGIHTLSGRSTAAYESARETAAQFIGAKPEQIVFTSGATDGVNRVARAMEAQLRPGDTVAATRMEHHSNLLPWQQLCARKNAVLKLIPVTDAGELAEEEAHTILACAPKLLAVTHCSNLLGTVNHIASLCAQAHRYGTKVLVDGAQSVCHRPINVEALGCDYFVLSGHKLGGPFGIGALYVREPLPSVVFGGGMVEQVWDDRFIPASAPLSGEAGTPNVSGAVGLSAAIQYRRALPDGWQEHEQRLLSKAEEGLRQIPGVRILGAPRLREGCLSFAMRNMHPFDAAVLLDQLGIAVRSGHHCAQPLLRGLGLEYALRVSPAFYNTAEEIDAFLDGIRRIHRLSGG